MLKSNENPSISEEIKWVVTNVMFGGNKKLIKYLVSQGCIPLLLNTLTTEENVNLVINTLRALGSVSEK